MAIKEIKREWSPEQLDYVKHYLLHYEADVKDLPKCCIGSRATVSETDNEYVCAECGWVRADFVELSALCPDLLSDPDVEIYYDPDKTEIGDSEHWKDTSIVCAYFPHVKSIGKFAFQDADNLEYACFPEVEEVGNNAFRNCEKLKAVYLPKCTEIKQGGFDNTGIVHVYFPEVTKIGDPYGLGFLNCASLERVDLPKLKTITPEATFDTCTSLVEINCPELEAIPGRFLVRCTAIKKLDTPKATEIGRQAFALSTLETLILRNEAVVTLANTNAFQSCPIASGTGYIYVPAALIEDYKVAANWSTYAAQFRAIEDYPEICDPTMDEPITKGEAIELVNDKMAGAGGGGGVVFVTGTFDPNGGGDETNIWLIPDKSLEECKALVEAGNYLVFKIDGANGMGQMYLPLGEVSDVMRFSNASSTGSIVVTLGAADTTPQCVLTAYAFA